MRSYFLFLSSFCVSFMYGQLRDTIYNEDESVTVRNYNKKGQLHGNYKVFVDDYDFYLLEEGKYKNGKKEGKWRYYKYDVNMFYSNSKRGLMTTTITDYSQTIRNTIPYKNGVAQGEFYSEMGNLLFADDFEVTNYLCFGWFDQGNMSREWTLLNVVESPDKYGEKIGSLNFGENGSKDGPWQIEGGSANKGLYVPFDWLLDSVEIKEVYDDGSYSLGHVSSGKKIGEWSYYTKGAELRKTEVYSEAGVLASQESKSLVSVVFKNVDPEKITHYDISKDSSLLVLVSSMYNGDFNYWLFEIATQKLIRQGDLNIKDSEICDVGFSDTSNEKLAIINCTEYVEYDYELNLRNNEITKLNHKIPLSPGYYYDKKEFEELNLIDLSKLESNWSRLRDVDQFYHQLKISTTDEGKAKRQLLLDLSNGHSKIWDEDKPLDVKLLAKENLNAETYAKIDNIALRDENFSTVAMKYYRSNERYGTKFFDDIKEMEPIGFFILPGQQIAEKKQFHFVYNNLASFTDRRDGDDMLFFWNAKTKGAKQRFVKLNVNNQGDFIFYTPDNYYMASKGIEDEVYFEKDLTVFPLEQFDLKFNRPDIVLERLGYADSALLSAFHHAYLKRIKKLGFTEEMLKDDFHLPSIEIDNIKSLPKQTSDSLIELELNINDDKYLLDRVNVWINDVAIYGRSGISLKDKNTEHVSLTLPIHLAKGDNKIQVSVLNQSGAESYKETMEINCTHGKSSNDLYLITIGAGDYQVDEYDLSFAAKDAEDIATLMKKSKVYNRVNTLTLTNAEVKKEMLQSMHAFLVDAGINDEVIIFFAGHGVLDANLDYFLAMHDMDFGNPSQKGLSYDDMENVLDGIKPLKKVLMIDACHSGEIDKEMVAMAKNKKEETGEVQFRSVGNALSPKLGLYNTSELTQSLFTDLRKGTGATVISAAGGMEFAIESATLQNGLFTYCFIEGITSGKADLNEDGEIWLKEIQSYVQLQVSEKSEGQQKPTSRIENNTLDYRIW